MKGVWGLALLGMVGGWVVADAQGFQSGAFSPARAYEEKLVFEESGREHKFIQVRQVVHAPRAYGRLVSVTGSALWFEAEDGTIRNVSVNGGPVVIQRKGDFQTR